MPPTKLAIGLVLLRQHGVGRGQGFCAVVEGNTPLDGVGVIDVTDWLDGYRAGCVRVRSVE